MCCDLDRLGKWQAFVFCEEVAELVDQTFHLLGPNLKKICSSPMYTFFSESHSSCHHIEHTLRSLRIVVDLSQLYNGTFFAKESDRMRWVKNAAKISHTTAHFFATMEFFLQLKIIHITHIASAYVCVPYIAAAVGTCLTIFVIYQTYIGKEKEQALIMSCSELFFQVLPYGQLQSVAGIIHAYSVAAKILQSFHSHTHSH